MRILFLHQNFPGQFLHIASALQRLGGHQLIAVVPETNTRPPLIPTFRYQFDVGHAKTNFPLAENYVQRAARGMAVARLLLKLRDKGFFPDLVIGHGGWGETLFVRDVWPECRILVHAEFFYSSTGADAGFDPEFSGTMHKLVPMQVRSRNVTMSLAVLDADGAVAPTRWQASRFPLDLRRKISLAHEGINTDLITPSSCACVQLPGTDHRFQSGDEVVTFVNRNLEPHRGYHIFMRALPKILSSRPLAHVVIVGGDETSYGPNPPGSTTWKQTFLDEVKDQIDLSRVHFVGRVPHSLLVNLLQVSAAHIYLTYPFVLSWSMLDAMAAGALVIGSSTAPIEEVIKHGENGLLVDFFDVDGIAAAVSGALAEPSRYKALRESARKTIVDRFDLKRVCLPKWLKLVSDVAGKPLTAVSARRGACPQATATQNGASAQASS